MVAFQNITLGSNILIRFRDISNWLEYWLIEPRLEKPEQAVLERYYYSYLKHFGPYLRQHYASQIHELETVIADSPGCRVLEIGCGCGTESIWLGLLGASVIGLDLQQDRLRTAKARLEHTRNQLDLSPNVQFKEGSVFDVADLGKFDVIWMEQAFHHVEPRKEFLGLLVKLIKVNGSVVISETNAWNPLIQLQLLFKRGTRTIKEKRDVNGICHPYGDERVTTPGRLARELNDAGFSIISVRYFRIFPNKAWADRLGWLESAVPKWVKPAFTHYNIVAKYKGLSGSCT